MLLIDEIDKAEPELPNGLLEALGAREFTPAGRSHPVRGEGKLPLVIITTNEERALPNAFLRRCLVLTLELPREEATLIEFLMERGGAHFPKLPADVRRKAADLLVADRRAADRAQARPGQAEYLDLLRAVSGLPDTEREDMLDTLRGFITGKHRQGAG